MFGQFFFNYSITFLATCGCASDFLKMLLKLKMAARCQLQNFLRLQKLTNSRLKLFKFYNHIPHDIEMCMCFLQGFTEIQNGRHALP